MNSVQRNYINDKFEMQNDLLMETVYCQDEETEINYSSASQDSDLSNEDCSVVTPFTDVGTSSLSSPLSLPSSPLSSSNDYDMCNSKIHFDNDKSLYTANNNNSRRNKTIYVNTDCPVDFFNILPTVFKYPIFNGTKKKRSSCSSSSTTSSLSSCSIINNNNNNNNNDDTQNDHNGMEYMSDLADYSDHSDCSHESSDDSNVIKLSSIFNGLRKSSNSSLSSAMTHNNSIEDVNDCNSLDGGNFFYSPLRDSNSNDSMAIRFPLNKKPFSKSGYSCHWYDCTEQLSTTTKLLEHLQSKHVNTQTFKETFVCLWNDCKVYNRPSCSRLWLERHVLTHGGNRPFRCIMDGCGGQRFSSHFLLERHINRHFRKSDSSNNSDSTAPKLIRRNGQKLRYRRQPFSVHTRTDVFDVGIMLQLQYLLVEMTKNCEQVSLDVISSKTFLHITFKPRIIGCRVDLEEKLKYLVRWCPYNILDDEWMSESEINKTKSVPLWKLPQKIQEPFWNAVFPNKRLKPSHQSRKHKLR